MQNYFIFECLLKPTAIIVFHLPICPSLSATYRLLIFTRLRFVITDNIHTSFNTLGAIAWYSRSIPRSSFSLFIFLSSFHRYCIACLISLSTLCIPFRNGDYLLFAVKKLKVHNLAGL